MIPLLIANCHCNLHIPLSRLGTFVKLCFVQNEVDVIPHISWQDDLREPQTGDWSRVVELGRVVLDLASRGEAVQVMG